MVLDEQFSTKHRVARSGPSLSGRPGGNLNPTATLLPASDIVVRMEFHGAVNPVSGLGVPSCLEDWSQLLVFDYNPPAGSAELNNPVGEVGIYENWSTNFFGGPYTKYMFSYGNPGGSGPYWKDPAFGFGPGLWYNGFARDIKYRLLFELVFNITWGILVANYSIRSISINESGAPALNSFSMSNGGILNFDPTIDRMKISQVYPITTFRPVFTLNSTPPGNIGWGLFYPPSVVQERRVANASDTAWFNSPLNF